MEKQKATSKKSTLRNTTMKELVELAKGYRKQSVRAKAKRTYTPEERYRMIEKEAYFIAENRGFQGGNPVQDWVEAEMRVDDMILK